MVNEVPESERDGETYLRANVARVREKETERYLNGTFASRFLHPEALHSSLD